MKTSTLDSVFTAADRRAVRNGKLLCIKRNFKEICKKNLETERLDEKARIDLREVAVQGILCDFVQLQTYPEQCMQGMLEHSLDFYAGRLDCLFRSMHRIAYFEGLLNTALPEISID